MNEPSEGVEQVLKSSYADPVLNIALDTIDKDRQLICFCSTKRGAESQSEKIAVRLSSTAELQVLSQHILAVISPPTKQCKRLAACVAKGSAFHHAGLPTKQRELIEDAFREKVIKVICATPTLAAGVDLPAFRVIVRDLKRYGGPWGMSDLPVLEVAQMLGRAGRPGKDPWGEGLFIAKNDAEKEGIIEQYVNGEPEEIYSKLAVEPVLRTYVLSLVASEFVRTVQELKEFFSKTLYAHQYGDMDKLNAILERVVAKLQKWGFLEGEQETQDFQSASALVSVSDESLKATPLGNRVSELYLDPYTAHHLIRGFMRFDVKRKSTFAFLHLAASTLELRPFLKVKVSELDLMEERLALEEHSLLHIAPKPYSDEYDTYLDTIKTAMLFESWVEEESEDGIMEKFGVRPGEIHAKLAIMDWIVYASYELASILGQKVVRSELAKLRVRLKQGAKEELLPLLKLRDVGRIRARKLYRSGVKDVAGIQKMDSTSLAQLVGKALAIKLKEQVGQKVDEKDVRVKENKRKGQISLKDF